MTPAGGWRRDAREAELDCHNIRISLREERMGCCLAAASQELAEWDADLSPLRGLLNGMALGISFYAGLFYLLL